jgi:hypothetical protein
MAEAAFSLDTGKYIRKKTGPVSGPKPLHVLKAVFSLR